MGRVIQQRDPQAQALHRKGCEAARLGYVDMLSRYLWHWFATNTFRNEVHPERADKLFRLWVSKMNRQLFGQRWAKKGLGIYWARCLEYQKRDVLHYHSLMGGHGLDDMRRLTQMDVWNELAGYSRIEPPRNHYAVENYVAKYLTKDGEIELGGPLVPIACPLYDDNIESPTTRQELGVEIEPPQGGLLPQTLWDDGVVRSQSALVPSRMQPRSARVRAAKSGRS